MIWSLTWASSSTPSVFCLQTPSPPTSPGCRGGTLTCTWSSHCPAGSPGEGSHLEGAGHSCRGPRPLSCASFSAASKWLTLMLWKAIKGNWYQMKNNQKNCKRNFFYWSNIIPFFSTFLMYIESCTRLDTKSCTAAVGVGMSCRSRRVSNSTAYWLNFHIL